MSNIDLKPCPFCGEVDPHDPLYEMGDEDIEDMINRLFTPKVEVCMQQEETDG